MLLVLLLKLLRKMHLSNFGKPNGNRTEGGCKRDRVQEHPYQHVCDHSFHTAIRFLPLLKKLHQTLHFLKAGDIFLRVPFQSLLLLQKDKQYGQSLLLLLLCKVCIHICPFIVFAHRCVQKVFCCGRHCATV